MGELLEVSIISGIFGLVGLMILNLMWFKKENFKFNRSFQKRKQDLEFKKLARDLGLSSGPRSKATPGLSPTEGITVSPEIIGQLAKAFTGGEGQNEEDLGIGEGGLDGLIKWGLENPDNPIVKGFMQGIQKATTGNKESGEEFL